MIIIRKKLNTDYSTAAVIYSVLYITASIQ